MSLVHIVGVIALILIGWRYLVRHIFREITKTKLREIFTAVALFLVIGIALLMQQVELPMALMIVLVEWIINRRMTLEVSAETMPEQSNPVILVGVSRMVRLFRAC